MTNPNPAAPLTEREIVTNALRAAFSFTNPAAVDGLIETTLEQLAAARATSTPAGLPSVDEFERAIQEAYDQHDDHRTRHPGHSGECQDDWASAWRLAPLVRTALQGADR